MRLDHKQLQEYVGTSFIRYEKHPYADLHIYGYYEEPDKKSVWDNNTKLCRGIILDGDGNVIEKPFSKFWTFKQYIGNRIILLNDNQVLRVPDGRFRITEKIDGTMTTLYWIGDTPFLATQRSFTNIKAIEATRLLHSEYGHLIKNLDKRHTWVFEAVYPEINVLIDYGQRKELVLIGCIDKESGRALPVPDIGFPRCKDFSHLNQNNRRLDELMSLNLPNQEGFVLYYQNGDMVKLKFPWYLKAHALLDKLLKSEREEVYAFRELSKIDRILPPLITIDDVRNALAKGDNALLSIKATVPRFYYRFGFDYWIEQMKNRIKGGGASTLIIDIPTVFDINDRIEKPHIYETIVWKWKERFLPHCDIV